MYGYEELASYTSGDIRSNDGLLGLRFYEVKNTDKIIHAYEARINELENIIKVDNAIRITKLEAENTRLKADLMGECELRITIENIRDELEAENAQLKAMKWISRNNIFRQFQSRYSNSNKAKRPKRRIMPLRSNAER